MPANFVIETFAFRMLARSVAAMLLVAALAYPADWAVWRTREARGGGMGSVLVDRFTVAELKGGREDFYPNGTALVPCSRSIYPQGGNDVCWWLERHREVLRRY
jgi:hypothetical protein